MKKWWLLLFGTVCIYSVSAQNNFFFGHYMFNPSYFNPGWIGGEDVGFVTIQHRSQWLGYSTSFYGSGGAPATQMISAVVPIEGFSISSVGMNISNDQLGALRNIQLQFPMSYSKELRVGMISIGVAPALFSQTLDFSELDPNDPDDPLVPQIGSQTANRPNLSAGFFFRADRGMYIGASILNILEPGFSYDVENLGNKQKRTLAIHGGRLINIGDELTLSPTFLVRSNLNGFTFDVGAIAILRHKMWGGLSYRKQESAILYLGYSLLANNKLKVGYSFDYIISNRRGKSPTSHEVFIKYDLPNLVFGGRKSVKTPRFSY